MHLPLYIAKRYLFARKSHNVINIISAISSIGMAVGTAALILILSVYNGFDGIIKDNLSDMDPDVLVRGATGKYFATDSTLFDTIADDPRVECVCDVIEDNVFLKYGEQQGIAKAKGIDPSTLELTGLAGHIVDGTLKLQHGETAMACVGSGLAYKMGIHPRFVTPVNIYYPDRESKVSLSAAASSLNSVKVFPGSLFSVNASIDAETIILPISAMRQLIGSDSEATGVEIRLKDGSAKNVKRFISDYRGILGESFVMQDRYSQHPSLFKMMKYEKAAVFFILIFVVLIIAFNIFGSLSMLVIEKGSDISTLKAMGATDTLTRRIFVLEGWLITLVGMAAGLVIGLGLALIQQKFGLIKMPGSFLIDAYPVIIKATDILLTVSVVALIGLLIAEAACRISSLREASPQRQD